MSTRGGRGGVLFPPGKRRKIVRRPATRRRLLLAILLAVAAGVGWNLVTRHHMAASEELPELENTAALQSWPDSAGRAAFRTRRLERLGSECESAPRSRSEAVLDSFPSWSDDVLGLVACRRIRAGFTADQLRAAWGPPASIIPDLSGMRPVEQWDYGTHSVLIWDGQVRSWE